MADRIITLKDDDNNPTFPIAGGMMANSVTTAMLKDSSVTSDKIDWTTLDTGWVDVPYNSGYKAGTNAGTGQLRARVRSGALYLCGGVSKTDGTAFALNTEAVIAKLPNEIISAWRGGYTGATLNARSFSAAQAGLQGPWTVVGSVEGASNEGNIVIRTVAGQNQGTTAAWVQAAPCFGLCPYQG